MEIINPVFKSMLCPPWLDKDVSTSLAASVLQRIRRLNITTNSRRVLEPHTCLVREHTHNLFVFCSSEKKLTVNKRRVGGLFVTHSVRFSSFY